MKKIFFMLCLSSLDVQATSITIFNKSKSPLLASLARHGQSAQKYRIQPRKSHVYAVELQEHQPLQLTIEQGTHYWPQQFELALVCKGQLVLKRNSMVVSSKFSKSRATTASPIKIGYFGTTGPHTSLIRASKLGELRRAQQEIAFLK